MTLTITLPTEIEARLRSRAQAKGFSEIEDYAKKVLEDDLNNPRTLDEIFAPYREHTETLSESEIDDLVKRARRDAFADKSSK